MEQTERNVTVVKRLYEEVLCAKNLAVVDEVFAPKVLFGPGRSLRSREEVKRLFTGSPADPVTRFEVMDAIASDDRVAARLKVTWTEPVAGPDGVTAPRALEMHTMASFRLRDGLIEECLEIVDRRMLGLQRQPAPAEIERW